MPDVVGLYGFSQDTVKLVVDTAVGVKIKLLAMCPAVLLVSMAVNPLVVEVAMVPTGYAVKKETPGEVKTPGRVVCHRRVFPEVRTHMHILCSLSPGHRFLSLSLLQSKVSVA